jgi:SAM-dependent methyltransferase
MMISSTASLRRLLTSRAATSACRRRLSYLPTAIGEKQRILACAVSTTTVPVWTRRQMSTQATSITQQEDDHQHVVHHPASAKSNAKSLIGMSIDPEESRKLYDEWAPQYDRDVRKWGYDLPEQVATLVAKYVKSPNTKYVPHKTSILDAGAGSGLAGAALRQQPGFGKSQAFMIGADYSAQMLEKAATSQENPYDALVQLNLNQTPFCNNKLSQAFLNGCNAQTSVNIFDAIICVGTMTYVDPKAGTLREFCRWVKPGGYICYTHRTDKFEAFRPEEEALEQEGVWSLVEKVGPLPYLPDHPEFAEDIQVLIYMYQKNE